MRQPLTVPSWVRLGLDEAPGLSEYLRRWWKGEEIPRPAGGVIGSSDTQDRRGEAWRDAAFLEELRGAHLRLGASDASRRNLDALASGADCVITGQQPAVLGGPLYCAWKIAGAVGLARALEESTGRRVVPVYWCGADDSDLEEARGIWVRDSRGALWRGELAGDPAPVGGMVGSVRGAGLVEVEEGLRALLGDAIQPRLAGLLDALDPQWDLAERVSAALLGLFAEDGLVVVDARSPRLRELGRPLHRRYLEQHRRVAEAVDARGEVMESRGLPRPLHPTATRSGLFRVEDGIRYKLGPEELDAGLVESWDLSPSVLLRAPLQDQLLAPVVAVLGPSELQYHAQLAPLYEMLGIQAAAPAPRPHLVQLPPGVELPQHSAERRELLRGGDSARRVLTATAIPTEWIRALDRFVGELDRGVGDLGSSLGLHPGEAEIRRLRGSLGRSTEELRERLAARAWGDEEEARVRLESALDLLAVRGVPQERAYATWMGWQWWGEEFPARARRLGELYAREILSGEPTLYAALSEVVDP